MGPDFTKTAKETFREPRAETKARKSNKPRFTPVVDILVFGQPNSGKDVFIEKYVSDAANSI